MKTLKPDAISSGLAGLGFIVTLIVLSTSGCVVTRASIPPEVQMAQRNEEPQSVADVIGTPFPLQMLQEIGFSTNEGTWMALDVSPNGKTIVFDLLGDLYLLPIEGGDAVPLTQGLAWDQSPKFSPDGKSVFFISDRRAYKNVWRVSIADRSVHQVSRFGRDVQGSINWERDGGRLISAITGSGWPSRAAGDVFLHYVDPNTGASVKVNPSEGSSAEVVPPHGFRRLRPASLVYSGVGGEDYGRVFFSEMLQQYDSNGRPHRRVGIHEYGVEDRTRVRLTPEDASYSEFKPQLSRDGALLAYFRQYDNRVTELRLLDLGSREDRLVTTLKDAEDAMYSHRDDHRPNFAFASDDKSIFYWHAGRIWNVGLEESAVVSIPFRVDVKRIVARTAQPIAPRIEPVEQAITIRFPSISRDGNTVVFAAAAYVWSMDVTTGHLKRLTGSDEYAFTPAISPDGKLVAYTSFSSELRNYSTLKSDPFRQESGALNVIDIEGRNRQQLLAEPQVQYLSPAWSEDGSKIAVLRRLQLNVPGRYEIGWTLAANGSFNRISSQPNAFVYKKGNNSYSYWVGFDESGEQVIFSYPVSQDQMALAKSNLDGSGFRLLALGTSEVGGIVSSPDLENLIIMRADGTLWHTPFSVAPATSVVSTFATESSRIGDTGGLFVNWYGKNRLSYGFGSRLYQYDLQTKSLQENQIDVPIRRPTTKRPMAFVGARLITLAEEKSPRRVVDDGVLVIEAGRITHVGSKSDTSIPDNALIIDVKGNTIVPGFIDTHYHGMGLLDGFAVPHSRLWMDPSAIRYGMTTAWAPAGPVNDAGAVYFDMHAAGRVIGPRWSYTLELFSSENPLFTVNATAAKETVERFQELNVTVMKESGEATRLRQQRASSAASASRMGIVAHLSRFDQQMTRLVDGYTGGEHPYFPIPFYKDVQQLLSKSGFVWTPNVAITLSTINGLTAEDYYCEAISDAKSQGAIEFVNDLTVCEGKLADGDLPDFALHRGSRFAEQMARSFAEGTKIGVSAHDRPASNLHMEMWLLHEGGMKAEDVLYATTMINAKKLGLADQIGSLEVGKLADFVVLDGNPLENILNTISVDYTVQFGRIYDADTATRIVPGEFQSRLEP